MILRSSAKLERARNGTILHVKVMGLSNNSHLIKHSDRNMMPLFGKLEYQLAVALLLQHQLTVAPCLSVYFLFVHKRTYATPTRSEKARKNRYALLDLRKTEYVGHEMPSLPLNHCQFLTFPALECLHQHSIIKASAHCLHKKMYHLSVRMMDYHIPIGQGKFQANHLRHSVRTPQVAASLT